MRSLLRKGDRKETLKKEQSTISFWRVGFVLLSLFVFALLLEKIGYLITSFLILTLLFRSTGSKGWRFALITSGVTALVTYFVFTYLGLRFPAGIFRLGGFLK
jgi:putative tricarboxylic transport membrane protein